MSNEINEYDEFERKLKMVHRAEDLKNQQVIYDFINQKKNQGSFKELYLKKRRRNFIFKVSSISFAAVFFAVFSALLLKDVIFPTTPPEPQAKPILKATYHIAYFEDIDIVDRLSKELNLKENEYAKFIFYKSNGDQEIFVRKDSLNEQPDYKDVVFNKLSYIFNNTINNFLKDTSSVKNLVILGNMPATPEEIIRNKRKQSLITKEQFSALSRIPNLEVIIFLSSEQTVETNSLFKKFDSNNIKYKIFK